MSDIVELERRITAALDRIGRGVEGLSAAQAAAPQIDPGEVEALKAALEDERTANAQLEERVKAIREKQDQQVLAMEFELSAVKTEAAQLREDMDDLDGKLSVLQQSNATLIESADALRAAAAEGIEPSDVIAVLEAELASLKAAREADRASLALAMTALEPLMAAKPTDAKPADEGEADA